MKHVLVCHLDWMDTMEIRSVNGRVTANNMSGYIQQKANYYCVVLSRPRTLSVRSSVSVSTKKIRPSKVQICCAGFQRDLELKTSIRSRLGQ